ncbi:FMN-binding domain protein [Oxobacter pfennigii]|uniref:FMN-binding domain protein n=1 Tax=Oxobacter pfennigii TaxID=36849 RepID=A0A0P8WDA6_9CLOT|nr:FMN-binding protein [Oxobacter pfennigii]KPU45873.1 FMN-binding domain protein [Oxobacter pfennigii]
MKKILTMGLTVVLASALLIGCGGSKALKDGTYDYASEADSHGYKKTVQVTVAGGKITAATYDEVSSDNKKKSEDAEYKANYQKLVKDADPKATYEKLAASLVSTQDPSKVEVVAGATESSNGFKEAAAKALESAK